MLTIKQFSSEVMAVHSVTWADATSAIATSIAALLAGAAAIIAFIVYRSDKNYRRRHEIRTSSAELIRAMHDLAVRSKNSSTDNETDRNAMYKSSVFFELSVGKDLDRDRFNAAMNWILKASRIRHAVACDVEIGGHYVTRPWKYCGVLVAEATEALRSFDASGGKGDLTSDLATRFDKVFTELGYGKDAKIHKSLIVEDKYYERLVLRAIPEFAKE